jgi:hypothetical protein
VGVNIDAAVFGLPEQLLHVLEVVAADQDSGSVADADIDRCYFRVAIGLCIGLVEKRHSGDSLFARLHDKSHHLINGEIFGGRDKRLHYEIVDFVISQAEHRGVIGIGGNPLEPDRQQLAE